MWSTSAYRVGRICGVNQRQEPLAACAYFPNKNNFTQFHSVITSGNPIIKLSNSRALSYQVRQCPSWFLVLKAFPINQKNLMSCESNASVPFGKCCQERQRFWDIYLSNVLIWSSNKSGLKEETGILYPPLTRKMLSWTTWRYDSQCGLCFKRKPVMWHCLQRLSQLLGTESGA